MGKPKKGKKGKQDDDFGDDDVDIDVLAASEPVDEQMAQKSGKQKKGKKNKKLNQDEDIESKMESLSLESDDDMDAVIEEVALPSKQKKKDKKKAKKKAESDEEDFEEDQKAHAIIQRKYAMLEMEEDNVESSEDEKKPEMIPVNEKPIAREDSVEDKNDESKQKQQKKGKKDKKKKKNQEEDIDALLAEIDGKTAQSQGMDFKDQSAMTEEDMLKAMEAKYDDEEDKKKNKAKKKKGGKEMATTPVDDSASQKNIIIDDTETGELQKDGEMTAAQKKKEKKERQKQKKAEEKAKQKGNKGKTEEKIDQDQRQEENSTEQVAEGESETVEQPEVQIKQQLDESKDKETVEGETEKQQEGEDEEDSKKKKKKDRKKKKGEKEEEKADTTKKKTSKLGKLILEQQKKLREEEERIRLEMEEAERKLEEAQALKEEKERKEKERKEREKQKKKEKIERQKKEGTFLTAKQKEAQRIAQQKLEAMKAQGFEIPSEEAAKKRKPVYDSRKKKKQEVTTQSSQENDDEMPETIEKAVEEEKQLKGEVKEEDVKDAWDASDEEEVKDAWDAESEEEKEPEAKTKDPAQRGESVDQVASVASEPDYSDEDSSEEEDDSEEESSSDDEVGETAREKAMARIRKRADEAEKKKNTDKLRAAVVCVLGHVDTGKTKILDKLRKTNVQDNEAGGITQQIGATNVPADSIRDSTKMCKEFSKQELKLPGLLIIDTPGHESFSNLRTRGSSLCDIAILVVDIMHGLEAQTIESINLLKQRKCPFVVALNKIDRLFQWQPNPHSDIINVLKKQKQNTRQEFDERAILVKTQLSEQGLNAELFYDNKNPKEYISLVPTSAHSGDGMGNLIALICELTQNHLAKELAYSEILKATVMEVKALPGLGTTVDVILVNGKLCEGDTIIVPGTEGPIVTQIRGCLMPEPMKELRVKNAYVHHKEVLAAQGVKLIAKDLDHSLAGLPMYVAKYADEIDIYKEQLEEALEDILSGIKLQDKGVFVQASTLGSMEALLKYLKDSQIPYSGINIGPVHKRDVMKASVMLDRDPQYAVILAFDVKVERDAQDFADSLGIRIFTAEIIYHLFDNFMEYRAKYTKTKQEEFKHIAVFPCRLRVLPQYIFNSRDPIVAGVIIESGFLVLGTPLCVPSKENILLGQVTSIEVNHKQIEKAYNGQEVCIKIENIPGETPKLYGRHFEHTDSVVSKISRESIDAVKNYFRDEMTKSDWHVMVELKKLFQIL